MIISTFNLKNSNTPSISNEKWVKRMDSAALLIRQRKLGVVGTQELTLKAKNYLERVLEDYLFIGESRGSFNISDEYNSILLNREKVNVLRSETYSLSKDIYKKGGKFILDAFPRICTLAHIVVDGRKYLIINTHLNNQ